MDDAQPLGLQCRWHGTRLVDEKSASLGRAHLTQATHVSAGVCAFLMAEELALEKRFWNGRGVYRDEWLGGSGARAVNAACEQFLPGAGLADDEH